MKLSFLETDLDHQSSFGPAKHAVKKKDREIFERDPFKSDIQYTVQSLLIWAR
jgi:hypothetical protein